MLSMKYFLVALFSLKVVVGVLASTILYDERIPNNRLRNLEPPSGAWRGATLGKEFHNGTGSADDVVGRFDSVYPDTPLQLYRHFASEPGISNETAQWVKRGGILWYNIKPKDMSWERAANGAYDQIAVSWAADIVSLAPANVFVTIYHEADHNVCFSECHSSEDVPGNTPENYRSMWARIQNVFASQNVTNAVWVMDYSEGISRNATLANAASGCVDDGQCTPASTIAPLWPGNDRVDWVRAYRRARRDRVSSYSILRFTRHISTTRVLTFTKLPSTFRFAIHSSAIACSFFSTPLKRTRTSITHLNRKQRLTRLSDPSTRFSNEYPTIQLRWSTADPINATSLRCRGDWARLPAMELRKTDFPHRRPHNESSGSRTRRRHFRLDQD